ncbi:uncharacterized protein, partial [Diabrotica undecimpunctata]|uniref:uncharacterized protein n=1 Tax=Diabrotica undecimpunctata TaxID=50387 RepID=UPI003B63AAC8
MTQDDLFDYIYGIPYQQAINSDRKDKTMKMGEHDYFMSNDMSVVKWKDRGRKCVLVGSTMHNPLEITSVLRRKPNGEQESVKCPKAISDYNRYMGGVDLFDQLHASYPISWKSRR